MVTCVFLGPSSARALPASGADAPPTTPAPTEDKRAYNLPGGDAAQTLAQFAGLSRHQVFYLMDKVQGVQTNAISGVYSPLEALDMMLAGTSLTALRDENTGGFVVTRRQPASPAEVGVQPNTQPQNAMKKHTKVVAWVLALFGWTAATNLPAQTTAPESSPTVVQESMDDTKKDAVKKLKEEKVFELPAYQVTSTAQKDSIQRVFDIPNPVTVVSSETLVETNQLRLQDYAARMPGLTVVPTASGVQSVAIRGLYSGLSPTVAYLIDEVSFGWNSALGGGAIPVDVDPGDMGSVELLRGPQGTLYGASSLGGLIKYTTVDPITTGYGGRLSVGTTSVRNGDKFGYNVRGSVNVPLNETVGVGLSGYSRREPGYINRAGLGDQGINEQRAAGGRLSFVWRPAADWTLKVNAFFQRNEIDGAAYAQPELGEFIQATGRDANAQDRKFRAYSGTLMGKVGSVEVTSITGYNKQQWEYVNDLSFLNFLFGPPGNLPFGAFQFETLNGVERFSEELRLAFSWTPRVYAVIGGFYADAKSPIGADIWPVDASGVRVDNGYRLTQVIDNTYREVAGFANLTFKLTDQLDVQVGGRQSSMKQSSQSTQVHDSVFNGPLGPSPANRAEPDAFTYLLAPRFKVTPDLMIYARVASGYRVGGPNQSGFCAQGLFPCGFDPDTSKNYELGVKGNFLEQKLSVDASIYTIDWDDMQLSLAVPPGLSYTANVGKARSQGVEISAELRPREGLILAGWIAWNNAEIREDAPTMGWKKGDRLQFGTEWTGRLSVNQSFSLPKRLRGFVEVSGNYVGEREAGVGTSKTAPTQNYPDYINYDLSAGVRSPSGWSANLFVTNISDERGAAQGNPELRPTTVIYIQPRTVGVSVTREF